MNIRKKILWFLAIIGLWFCAFAPSSIVGNSVYAQAPEQTAAAQKDNETVTVEQALNELWTLIDMGLKLMYIVIWPMLFLAGIALDNSMVYGSFFHMDAPLWFFWNMTKNFANFALGFMVLFAILKWIFSSFGDKKDARSPIEIIKKTLIAGVLIQASWFIMSAVIDVSTIATYAIWGMPMTLLNDSDIKWAQDKIPQTESHLELNNVNKLNEEDFRVRYKTKVNNAGVEKTVEISPCLIKALWAESYIVWRKYGDTKFSTEEINNQLPDDMKIANDKFPTRNICMYWKTPFFFNEFPNAWLLGKTNSEYQSILSANLNALWWYTTDLEKCRFIINLENEDWSETPEDCQEVINKLRWNFDDTTKQLIENNDDLKWLKDWSEEALQADGYLQKITADTFYNEYWSEVGKLRFSKTLAPTVSTIIDKSKGFVGPFVTIYASIMDFANLSDGNSNTSSIWRNIWSMLIRTGVAVWLIFPLIALAVVLFIRIGFLRAVIAASPLLILVNVFKDTLKIDLGKHFTIENILKAIFAPVITVFALSISMIFMTTLSNSLSTNNMDKVNIMNQLWWTLEDKGKETSLTIAGFTIVYPKIVDTYAGATGDWFSWMLLSFCGIGIMRFILFAAIKATGTIGEVGEKIKDFGENVLKTAPIVPIPGMGMSSVEGLKYASTIPDQLTEKRRVREENDAEQFFGSKFTALKDEWLDTNLWNNKYETRDLMNILNTTSNNDKEVSNYLEKQNFIWKNATKQDINTFLGSDNTISAIKNEFQEWLEEKRYTQEQVNEMKTNFKTKGIDIESYDNKIADIGSINNVINSIDKDASESEIKTQIESVWDLKTTGDFSFEKEINEKTYTIAVKDQKVTVTPKK